jgi:bacterioferritin-associated ferredoxin
MVVCHCNAIRERDLREAARSGVDCPIRADAQMGRRPRCGQCIPYARELIAEERVALA